jgi:hypothetical protein
MTMEQSHGSALNYFICVMLHVPRYKPEEGWSLLAEIQFIYLKL